MKKFKSFKSFTLPVLLFGLYAVIHLFCLAYFDAFIYAFRDVDYLTVLFTTGFFERNYPFSNQAVFLPLQNIHLISALFLYSTEIIRLDSIFLLGIFQIGLTAIFVWRLHKLINEWIPVKQYTIIWVLIFVHPYNWILWQYSPSYLFTSIFLIETLYRLSNPLNQFSYLIPMFILSLCGSLGFILALIIGLTCIGIWLYKIQNPPFTSSFSKIPGFFAFIPLIPMLFGYVLFTYRWEIIGGPLIAGFQTPFSVLSLGKLLNGFWTERFIQTLIYWGNGGINASFTVLVFGFIGLLGLLASLQNKDQQIPAIIVTSLLIFQSILFSFADQENATYWLLPTLPVYLILVARGMEEMFDSSSSPYPVRIVTIFLSIALLVVYPFVYSSIIPEADYEASTCHAIEGKLREWDGQTHAAIAIEFTPSIFACSTHIQKCQPMGLRIHHYSRMPKHGEMSGSTPVSLKEVPNMISVFFPSFKEARQGKRSADERYYRHTYGRHQEPLRLHQLHIYYPTGTVLSTPLNVEEPTPFDSDSMNPHTFLNEENNIVGVRWNFELGYDHIQQTGIAFGIEPEDQKAAVGQFAAGSTHTPKNMGTFRSEPFIIEGDELQFAASFPSGSTESIFCLAVHQTTQLGESRQLKQARHIYDRQENESLVGKTFYYIRPEHLRYTFVDDATKIPVEATVSGWRVVRTMRGSNTDQWQFKRWSMDPWLNQQAIWFAADRDWKGNVHLDHIVQVKREPGYYWNFEDGNYGEWQAKGEAFGTQPARGPFEGQVPIQGFEGNYFINSYYKGSDSVTGKLVSPEFKLQGDFIEFRVGGGNDPYQVYVSLIINNNIVQRSTGRRTESMRHERWNVSAWKGQTARIEVVDQSSDPWGHILADDFRIRFD